MGYRSDVVLYVRHPEAKARLLMAAIDCELLRDLSAKTNACCDRYEATDEYVLIEYASIKWYESYPEVAAATKFISDCIKLVGDTDGSGYAAVFARIGENHDDNVIEGAGDYYDNVSIYRSFDINV
jgi:hypothetical protein